MSNFKRFASSDNTNRYDNGYVGREGELTWDIDNGLRIHDGSTNGGNLVGVTNYYGLSNRPSGDTAINDLIGYGSSGNDGKFMKQVSTGLQTWTALPTSYSTLTVSTLTSANVVGANVNVGGTTYTGLTADLGYGPAYRQVFLNANPAFMNFFNLGASIVGWKMYPTDNPSAYVTITEYLNNDLGGPSLGFDTSYLGAGPWTASSPGDFGPVKLTSNSLSWTFKADGNLQLPAGGDIVDSSGNSVLGGKTTPVTVATLPSASTAGAGARSFVTDGNSTTFYSIVGGSGSNGVPVFSDGTDWRIG